jgi:hypothetical protein
MRIVPARSHLDEVTATNAQCPRTRQHCLFRLNASNDEVLTSGSKIWVGHLGQRVSGSTLRKWSVPTLDPSGGTTRPTGHRPGANA